MAWKTVEIGSFLQERGDRFKPEEVNTLDLKRIEKIDFQGKIHVIDHKPTKTNMILVKKGDLVISGINVEKGALAVYEEDEDVLATIHYSSYEYDKNQVDIEYLKWFLKSRTFQNIVKEQAGGGIKTELKPKKFLPLKIQLPGLNEQIDIARKIDNVAAEIDDLSETNNHNQTLLIQLRQAILQEAVQGKLIPQDPNDKPAIELLKRIKAEKEKRIAKGKIKKQKPLPPIAEDETPYELPQGWTWVRLGAIVEDERGITYGIVKMGMEPRMGGVKTLRCSDVKYRKIDLTNVRMVSKEISQKYKRTILKGHEILINIRGTLGGCCIAPEEIEGYNIAREIAMVPILKQIESKYVLDVLSSPYIQKTTFYSLRGIAYKGLNLNLLTSFLIPLPSLAEQKRIVAKVDQLMHLCDELETKLNQSKKDSEMLMQAVLYEAFS
jgi:type I restriction enzyme S subunit